MMPITYTIDPELGLISTEVTGALTTAETLEYFKNLASDPGCPEQAIEIVDFSEVTDFSLQYSQMHTITQEYQPTKATKEIVATIFHCPSDLAYGIGRMLQTLHEIANPNHVACLAKSQEDVERVITDVRSGG
jgi:hypothetical protein